MSHSKRETGAADVIGFSAMNPIRPDMPKTLPTAPVGSGPSVTVDSPVRPDMPRMAPPAPQMTPQQRRDLMQGARNTCQQARAAATDVAGRQAARQAFNAARNDIRTQFRNPPNVNKPYAPDMNNPLYNGPGPGTPPPPDINSPLQPGPGMKKGGAAYKDKIDLNQCRVNTVSKKNSSSSKW